MRTFGFGNLLPKVGENPRPFFDILGGKEPEPSNRRLMHPDTHLHPRRPHYANCHCLWSQRLTFTCLLSPILHVGAHQLSCCSLRGYGSYLPDVNTLSASAQTATTGLIGHLAHPTPASGQKPSALNVAPPR